MDAEEKIRILDKVQIWFREEVIPAHLNKTEELTNPKKFNINPFSLPYLSNFLTGNSNPESLAKALVYPRVLQTSFSTTFGSRMQAFICHNLSNAEGSTTPGIDIQFIDQLDNKEKYCQLKSGPNTINSSDVKTIVDKFGGVIRLAQTNSIPDLGFANLVVGILYGEDAEMNASYKKIKNKHHYCVYIGQEFWHRLTGIENFYYELIEKISDVAIESDFSKELEKVISELSRSKQIMDLYEKIK